MEAAWLAEPVLERVAWILTSHQAAFGRPLIPAAANRRLAAQELFVAPVVVLAHDDPGQTGEAAGGASAAGHSEVDPIGPRLIYANVAALRLWRRPWATMVGLPSWLTAEPVARAERARALRQALRDEAIAHYSGVRIDSHGRRFQLRGARLWTLRDAAGQSRGQAACFSDWYWL
ncbi:MEKHLA domain-containing protein [Synechococcus sp. CS-1328]|nr:MEKHLA domain-containing protein [Synechococcus sp. CS-1328]